VSFHEREHEDPKKPHEPLKVGLSALAVLALIGIAYVAHPVWMGIMLGTAMGFTSEPLYRWLAPRLRYKRALAALLTTVIGGVAALLIIGTLTYVAVSELVVLAMTMRVPSASDMLGSTGLRILERMNVSPDAFVGRLNAVLVGASERAAGGVADALSFTTSLVLTAVIAFFTMYYVLLQWAGIVRRLEHTLPLHPRHTRKLLNEFRSVGRSAFIGTMGTALVQGVLAGIGYTIAGVQQPMLWATITMIASFLPVVGTAVIWVPIAIVLGINGHTSSAIFLAIWGVLVVTSLADYVIRPRLVGAKGQMHPLPLLVSLLGGVEMFGLMGVIVGPILMALCLSILRIYEQERLAHEADVPAAKAKE